MEGHLKKAETVKFPYNFTEKQGVGSRTEQRGLRAESRKQQAESSGQYAVKTRTEDNRE